MAKFLMKTLELESNQWRAPSGKSYLFFHPGRKINTIVTDTADIKMMRGDKERFEEVLDKPIENTENKPSEKPVAVAEDEYGKLKKLNKAEQAEILKGLGVKTADIPATEDERIKKIIELKKGG